MQISESGPDREFRSEKTTAVVLSSRVFINRNAGFIWKKNGFFAILINIQKGRKYGSKNSGRFHYI